MKLASHESEPFDIAQTCSDYAVKQNTNIMQRFRQFAVTKAAVLLTSAVISPAAIAGSTIGDTSEIPYQGKGAWGTTGVSSFVFTRAMEGDTFDRALKSENGDHSWGLLIDKITGIRQCAWIENEYIDGLRSDPPNSDNTCKRYLKIKDDPDIYAKDINQCPDGVGNKCVDGVKIPLSDRCINKNAYYKFAPAKKGFDNIDYPEHGSGPFRYAGKVNDYVYSRWTRKARAENGRSWRMVRTEDKGWVWIRDMCTENDAVGGTPKTQDTVAGPNPNENKAQNASNSTPEGTTIGPAIYQIANLFRSKIYKIISVQATSEAK